MKLVKYILLSFAGLIGVALITLCTQIRPDVSVEKIKAKYADEDSRFLPMNGMEVHYKDEGEGFPILLLHGFAASLHTWDSWAAELARYYRVFRLDLPGYGITGPRPDEDYSIRSYMKFIEDFLAHFRLRSVVLAGNSFGGLLSWYYAYSHPEQVRKLILIDSAGYVSKQEAPRAVKLASSPVLSTMARLILPKFLVRSALKDVFADDTKVSPELVDRYYDLLRRQGNRQAIITMSQEIHGDLSQFIPKITTPTLILWGQEDTWIPVDNAYRFHDDLINSELVIYADAGHTPMEEIPLQSVDDALRFLSGRPLFDPDGESPNE